MGHENLELEQLDENCQPTGKKVSVVERGKWLPVKVSFELDSQGKPVVTESGSTTSTLDSAHEVVVFEFFGSTRNTGEFCSISARFFSDESKTQEVTGHYFSVPAHYGGWNLVYPLKVGLSIPSEVTLYYSLHFSNPESHLSNDWDPRLRLEPR